MFENIQVPIHSSIRIEDSKIMYFDPFKITNEPHDADIIFITHSHYDHFSPSDILKLRKEDTLFVIPKTMIDDFAQLPFYGSSLPNPVYTLAPKDSIQLGGISIKAIAAYNNVKTFHPRHNQWLGYLITTETASYYIAGDTDMNKDNQNVKCDVALVPIGGTYTMNAREAALFVNQIAPAAAIPTHYGSIVGSQEDAQLFQKNVSPEIKVLRLI